MGLKVENVTKKFGSFKAIDDLSLMICQNQVFGLLGVNDAGKTTTFRMILGLIGRTEGRILRNGKRMGHHTSHLAGYLPEERRLYLKLTVKDQLTYL